MSNAGDRAPAPVSPTGAGAAPGGRDPLARVIRGVAEQYSHLLTQLFGCVDLIDSAGLDARTRSDLLRDLRGVTEGAAELTHAFLGYLEWETSPATGAQAAVVVASVADLLARLLPAQVSFRTEIASAGGPVGQAGVLREAVLRVLLL